MKTESVLRYRPKSKVLLGSVLPPLPSRHMLPRGRARPGLGEKERSTGACSDECEELL